MPLTKVVFKHEINSQNQIIHTVTAKGLLAPFLKLTLGRKLKKELKKAMEGLADYAKKRSDRS